MAIHIDSDGNFFFGEAGTTSFDNINYTPVFSVTKDGVLTATSGTIGGISLNTSHIQSTNYSSGSAGFKIDDNGDAEFNEIKVRVKGNAGDISPSGVSDNFISIGDSFVYDFAGDLTLQGNTIRIKAQDDDAEDPSLTFQVSFDNPGFYAVTDGQNTQAKLFWSNGNANIIHSESDAATLYIDATQISIGGTTGGNSTYIGKNSSGTLGWHNLPSGNDHPDSDHSFAAVSHGTHVSFSGSGGDLGNASSVSRSDHSHSGVGSHSHTANDVTGTISVTSVSNGGFVNSLSYNNSNKTLTVGGSDTRNANISTRTHTPTANNSHNLGGFGQAWATVFRASESTGSDERLKNSIQDIDKGLDFINDLQPRKYKWNNDSVGFFCDVCDVDLDDINDSCDTEDCEGTSIEKFTMEAERDKWQYGFIAQELLTNLDSNTGYGLANYNAENDNYFYSPTNLVAVLTKAVQELSTQISDLTARVEALEG